jgi:hypothetical protein
MYYRSLLGLTMVAMASAKANPVTTMLIYGADPQPLAASVVGNVKSPRICSAID